MIIILVKQTNIVTGKTFIQLFCFVGQDIVIKKISIEKQDYGVDVDWEEYDGESEEILAN